MDEKYYQNQTSFIYMNDRNRRESHHPSAPPECKFRTGVHPQITHIDLTDWEKYSGSNGVRYFLFDRENTPRFPNLQSLAMRPIIFEKDAEAFSRLENLTDLQIYSHDTLKSPIIPLKLGLPSDSTEGSRTLDKLSLIGSSINIHDIGEMMADIPIRHLVDIASNRSANSEPNGYSKIQGLESVYTYHVYGEEILEALVSQAETLQHLVIVGSVRSGIEHLASLKRLRSLNISWAGDQAPLAAALLELPELTCLDIYCDNGQEFDVSFLSTLTNLTHLKLSQPLVSFDALTSLVNLQALSLSNCHLKEVNGLATMLQLEVLDISWNDLTSIEPLRDLVKIRVLFANDNMITSFAPLSGHKAIQVLDCSHNPLNIFGWEKDDSPLHSLPYNKYRDETIYKRGNPDSWNDALRYIHRITYSKKDRAFFPHCIDFQK